MALTHGDANDFYVILRWLGVPSPVSHPTDQGALGAILRLREKAYTRMMAGPSEDEVRRAFEEHCRKLHAS